MSPLIVAYIFSIMSVIAGASVCSPVFGIRFVFKLAVVWCMVLTAAYFTNILIVAVVVFVFALLINSRIPEVKVIYFVGLMPVMPLEVFQIPFPGINYLWDVNFMRLLVLFLFFPLILNGFSRHDLNSRLFHASDIYFVVFIFLVSILDVREGSFTDSMRNFLNILIDFVIPYYVISRSVRSAEMLHWVLCAFLLSAVILSFVSIFEVWSSWRFFTQIFFSLGLQFDPLALVPLFRDGSYRSSGGAMINQLAFAYFMSLACLVCFYLIRTRLLNIFFTSIVMVVCLVGLVLTDSKGGALSFIVGVFVLYYLKMNQVFRFFINILLVVAIPSLFIYFISTGFSSIDSEGSFAYRYQLILNSIDAVSNNPILGSINFLENVDLQRSIQGQGIIDVVNLYLQILLEFGFVGLFFYVMIFLSLIKGVVKKTSLKGFDHGDMIVALLISTMFFIATSSDVSFTPFYIALVWSIARAYIGFSEKNQSAQAV